MTIIRNTYRNLSDKQRVRDDLIKRLELEARINKTKQVRYEEDYYVDDTFALPSLTSKTTISTQTDEVGGRKTLGLYPRAPSSTDNATGETVREVRGSIGSRSTPTLRTQGTQADGTSWSTFTQGTQAGPQTTETGSDAIWTQEDKQLIDEYENDLNELYHEIGQLEEQMKDQGIGIKNRDEIINSLRRQLHTTNDEFTNAMERYSNLENAHKMSDQELAYLRNELQRANTLHRQAAEMVSNANSSLTSSKDEIKRLTAELIQMEQKYKIFAKGYNILSGNADISEAEYERTINQLKTINAKATARFLELNTENLTLKEKLHAKDMEHHNFKAMQNIESEEALYRFMEANTPKIVSMPAADKNGKVSLYYSWVKGTDEDGDRLGIMEDSTGNFVGLRESGFANAGFKWSMIAAAYQVNRGVDMRSDPILKKAYDKLRRGKSYGFLLNTRANLPALGDPSELRSYNKGKRSVRTESMASEFQSPPPSQPKRGLIEYIEPMEIGYHPDRPSIAEVGTNTSIGVGLPRHKLPTRSGVARPSGLIPERLALPKLRGGGMLPATRYKQLGTLTVSLKALHGGKLSLRMGENTKQMLGRVQQMTPDLCAVVKSLVYDGKVDKEAYDQLCMSDKHVFDDLLQKSNLVYSQKNWDDPKDVLMEEYQKLVGEVEIGNDNPQIKKKLIKVLTTMLACGMVKEKRYHELIEMLI